MGRGGPALAFSRALVSELLRSGCSVQAAGSRWLAHSPRRVWWGPAGAFWSGPAATSEMATATSGDGRLVLPESAGAAAATTAGGSHVARGGTDEIPNGHGGGGGGKAPASPPHEEALALALAAEARGSGGAGEGEAASVPPDDGELWRGLRRPGNEESALTAVFQLWIVSSGVLRGPAAA